jgi:hypothetical protein
MRVVKAQKTERLKGTTLHSGWRSELTVTSRKQRHRDAFFPTTITNHQKKIFFLGGLHGA